MSSTWYAREPYPSITTQKMEAQAPFEKLTEKPEGRILIVDDDYSLRRVLHTTLFATGFDVNEAASGDEALALARAVRFDVILLDLRMPGKGGLEICRELRQQF